MPKILENIEKQRIENIEKQRIKWWMFWVKCMMIFISLILLFGLGLFVLFVLFSENLNNLNIIYLKNKLDIKYLN